MTVRARPGKIHRLKDKLADQEIARLWDVVRQFMVSHTWRLFDNDDGIYVQKYDASTGRYISKVFIDNDGNIDLTGVVTPGATLEDVGRP